MPAKIDTTLAALAVVTVLMILLFATTCIVTGHVYFPSLLAP